jgi:thiol-disulfide isomerase/thioredoxin
MEATAGEASYMELLESAGAHYKNESKNYLSYIIVRNALRKNYDSTGSLLSIFFKQCTNEKYLTLIKAENQLRNLANSDNNSGEFLSQELKTKSLLDIVKSTEAKLVLVDFWASWCKPCLEEMRYSKNLQTVFRNESRIKFVYVSLDKSISVWKKTADDLRDIMNAKNTYLLLRGFDSDFAKNYTIFSIPRYMLINSKGEVVSFDAPKPDDQELQKQIYAHLNK